MEQFFAGGKWREFYFFAFVLTAYDDLYMGVLPGLDVTLFYFALFYFFLCASIVSVFFQFRKVNKVFTGKVLTCTVLFIKVPGIYIHRIPNVFFKRFLVFFDVLHFIGMRSYEQTIKLCFVLYNMRAVVINASDNIYGKNIVFVMAEVELSF